MAKKGLELQGVVPIELGGKTYKLRFDLNALCALEDRYGDIGAVLQANVGPKTARTLLWIALQSEHADEFPTEQDAGRLVTMDNFRSIMQTVGKAFLAAMPSGDDNQEGDAKN